MNDPPVARNDMYCVDQNTALTVSVADGVIANDTDVDSVLAAVKLSDPTHGTLAFSTDGSLTYTPVLGYAGPDSFTYRVHDGQADSNVATVSIDVRPTAGAPVVESVRINDGSAQRSMVTSLTIRFTTLVSLPDSVFRLVNKADHVPVPLNVAWDNSTCRTAATLTFSGAGIVGGSLADGNYVLTIDLEQDGFGAGSDYEFGANEADKFFRFFGDSDGDRDVDNTDYFRLRGSLNQTAASSKYLGFFDFDRDNDVDGSDQSQFLARYRKRLAWTP